MMDCPNYGWNGADRGYDIKPTADGGFIAVGETESFGYGESDVLVLKLLGDGSLEWQKTYGGLNTDQAFSVEQTADDGYILVGRTNSFSSAGFDAWVLKLDPFGDVGDNCQLVGVPNVTTQAATFPRDEITVFYEINSDEMRETLLSANTSDSTVRSHAAILKHIRQTEDFRSYPCLFRPDLVNLLNLACKLFYVIPDFEISL
jgi:hypothetical protein